MNKKYFILGILAVLIISTAIFIKGVGAHGKSGDDVPGHECEHGQHTYNPHCDISPTVSPTPIYQCEGEDCIEVTPTLEVTPTATPTAEVTPTDVPNQGGPGDGLHTGGDGRSDGGRSSDFDHRSPYDGQIVGWK